MVNENNAESVTAPERPFTEKTAEELQKEETAERAEENKETESETHEDVKLNIVDVPESEPEREERPEKRVLKKPAVIAVIASAAAALTALMLVLIFAVVIPASRPKVDVSKYITVSFDSASEFNGEISGTITVDKEAIESDFKNENILKETRLGSLDRMLGELRLEYSVEGKDKTNWGTGFVRFRGLGSGDVLTLNLSWEDDDNSKRAIGIEEKISGLGFEKEPATLTLNIGEYIEEQKIEIKKPIELNVLDYIGSNNLVITVPDDDDSLSVGIDRFKTEISGYTISNDFYFEPAVRIFDKNGNYFTSVYFDFIYDGIISEGSTVKLDYSADNNQTKGTGFLLTGEPVEYTVEKCEQLTADSVKRHPDSVKKYIAENLLSGDGDISENDKTEINAVYFAANGDTAADGIIAAVYTNSSKKYSKTIELSPDGYFSGDRFVFFGYTNISEKAKTADEAVKSNEYINGKNSNYTAEKLG